MIYHRWLMDADANFSPAYFSDSEGHWMCDANQGKPEGECDGRNYPYDLTGPAHVTSDGAIGGPLRAM